MITVVMTTYDNGEGRRTRCANRTLAALKKNLRYTGGEIRWIIADDGSPEGHIKSLMAYFGSDDKVFVTNAQRRGVGKSKNIALKQAFEWSPVVLLLEDDWELQEPFVVDDYVNAFDTNPELGMIRLGFLGGEMLAKYTQIAPHIPVWELQVNSGLYVYSGQVSLRHKRFYDIVGMHREGVDAGTEELDMCHTYNQIENPPKIVWLANYAPPLNRGLFTNIGMDSSTNTVQPEGE